VISPGAPTAPYTNYINNFIKILLNVFRGIVILQPFLFIFYKFGRPHESGGPQALLLLLLCKSATVYHSDSYQVFLNQQHEYSLFKTSSCFQRCSKPTTNSCQLKTDLSLLITKISVQCKKLTKPVNLDDAFLKLNVGIWLKLYGIISFIQ